tara:strand:+ start:2228 stop:2608 length:381 start_codon:yes stop_codon:yes gene_type:complete
LNILKKNRLLTSNLNKTNDINRGVQFILLNGRKKKNGNTFQITFPGGKKMTIDTDILLSLLLPVSLLFFFVGLLGGWVARDYMMNYREIPRPHPEMFDGNGNLVPDEVIAFNFENYHDDNESEEDD